jgi:hypothetical protein
MLQPGQTFRGEAGQFRHQRQVKSVSEHRPGDTLRGLLLTLLQTLMQTLFNPC